jgi:hypothetical protein
MTVSSITPTRATDTVSANTRNAPIHNAIF